MWARLKWSPVKLEKIINQTREVGLVKFKKKKNGRTCKTILDESIKIKKISDEISLDKGA